MPPPGLRTLDAIHLATAFDLGPVIDVVLSYDRLLIAAARNAGLDTVQPGPA
jgi:predicted nucleic acid-binding protein